MPRKHHCGSTETASYRKDAPWVMIQTVSSHPQWLIAARKLTQRDHKALEVLMTLSPRGLKHGVSKPGEPCSKTWCSGLPSWPGLIDSSTPWSKEPWGCCITQSPPRDFLSAREDPPDIPFIVQSMHSCSWDGSMGMVKVHQNSAMKSASSSVNRHSLIDVNDAS